MNINMNNANAKNDDKLNGNKNNCARTVHKSFAASAGFVACVHLAHASTNTCCCSGVFVVSSCKVVDAVHLALLAWLYTIDSKGDSNSSKSKSNRT